MMRIRLTSVFVHDQDAALDFYTRVLGFVKKADFPVGEFKWLTIASPEEPDGPEVLLEPDANPAARDYKAALFEQGMPAISFAVDDIHGEHERLRERGVEFRMEPTEMPGSIVATLDDTCGNLVMLYQTTG